MKTFMNTLLSIVASLSLMGCGGSDSNNDSVASKENINKNISIQGVPHVESLGIGANIHANVSLGDTPTDVYVLLSNYAHTDGIVQIQKSLKSVEEKKTFKNVEAITSNSVHAPEELELFRSKVQDYLKQTNVQSVQTKVLGRQKSYKDVSGMQKTFYLDASASESTAATARKVVSINTVYGTKTLNVWVSNDSYGVGCQKSKCVTQNMVDALTRAFLTAGNDNDVYDWVTNVYGAEWGNHNEGNLITNTNEVTILLTDISNDNSISGGVVGFYHPKDNFTNSSAIKGTNERIMLYADSVLFANGEGSWSINDYWPKEMVSTLAHEFQHMIHFYQKGVLLSSEATDTWINEMLSESTEDLIASKIGHTGSRGVDPNIGSAGNAGNTIGRYPQFNANNRLSLTTWTGSSLNYSNVNAFGAFLMRNYGGAKVLHDIMHVSSPDEQAIVHAVQQTPKGSGKTFNDLLREWGIAVLLSDDNHLGADVPRYNTGGYMPNSYNRSVYQLGSVNFFNYNPTPSVSSASGTVANQGNYYYKIGSGLKGEINIDIKLSGQTEATLIVK